MPAGPDPVVVAVTAELHAEIDDLRDQLEAAFGETIGKLDRVELRLASLRQNADAQAAALQRVDERSAAAVELASHTIATLEEAIATSRAADDDEPYPALLGPIHARLGRIDEALLSTQRQLERLLETPARVDTRNLEDVATRGALHNAADIANLRQDVEALVDAVRMQDAGLGELRSTLDWIKERLLR